MALGLVMAAQAIFCGYYTVFVVLMVGFGVLTLAALRGWWTNVRYWKAIALAAATAVVAALPVLIPYLALAAGGFRRDMSEAARYSADWQAYLASNALAHQWLLPLLGHWNEVLFPGFAATLLGVAGLAVGWRQGGRLREAVILYGGLLLLAGWASFGPEAGLYRVLYRVIPVFSLMRAPARFGVIVALGLAVSAGIAVRVLLARVPYSTSVGMLIALAAAADLAVPLPAVPSGSGFREVPPVSPIYRMLRRLPPAPVIELPFWWRGSELHGHSIYMLSSTIHWMPLINGYSDYIPPDFIDDAGTLRFFPSAEAFKLLQSRRPRYAVFHMAVYGDQDRADVERRIGAFSRYLRPLYRDEETRLYEIVGFPP